MTDTSLLGSIEHIVVLMLENRSFDHMLGFLYADHGNTTPSGAAFDGLTGHEANPDQSGTQTPVFKITPSTPNAYFMPGADPGEGYVAANNELFGSVTPPVPPNATNSGFVKDFAYTLNWQQKEGRSILPGTVPGSIMGVYTPDMLPILSGLARGYAVCDRWFASVPTETLPNRAFAAAATSQGHMDDKTKSFTCPSIFGSLTNKGVSWAIHGYDLDPLTRLTFTDTRNAPDTNFGRFSDFTAAAASGHLPAYVFLEPSWGSAGNSQHPNYDVALGERLIHDVYYAVRNGSAWNQTLLVVTYDEHGGCYDHVPPPLGAVPPDASVGEAGFDFKRFGVRVPTVLISPLIEAATVFRAPTGAPPFDHTSLLKTIERRWGLVALTARDAAAADISGVLTRATPRIDDPLAGVNVPVSAGPHPAATEPSHLQEVYAELASELPVPDDQGGTHHSMPTLRTAADYTTYIESRTRTWKTGARMMLA